jgi:hypothetical protein
MSVKLHQLSSLFDDLIQFKVDSSRFNQQPEGNALRGAGVGFLGGGIVGAGGGAIAGKRFQNEGQIYLKRDAFGHAVIGNIAGAGAAVGLSRIPKLPAGARFGAAIGTAIGAQQLAAAHTLKKRTQGQ